MRSDQLDPEPERVGLRWVRLVIIVAIIAGAWFALDALMDLSRAGGGQGLFGLGFLFLVPFGVGLILGVTIQRFWPAGTSGGGVALWTAFVFFSLSFLTGPGVICVIMALPIWFPALFLGGIASNLIVRRSQLAQAAFVALALVAAGGHWGFDQRGQYPTLHRSVERTIVIAASPDQIWPHLLRLDKLGPGEGRWTISQNILGVPRPIEAIVRGEGAGAIRTGRWRGNIWFEEHVVAWGEGRRMEWVFVFPDGSTFASIDQHIDPRGPNVVVERGGYSLEPLANDSTRLRLYTTYSASTAVNGYASMWAEQILGDVQANILAIVKARVELEPRVIANSHRATSPNFLTPSPAGDA